MKLQIALGVAAAGLALAAPAKAQDEWSKAGQVVVSLGAAGVLFNENARVSAGGARVAGGNMRLSDNVSASFDIGYFVAPHFELKLIVGIPPTTTLNGSGTLSSAGRLGKVTYGPVTLLADYYLPPVGPVRPFLAAGLTYTYIFGTKDGFLQNVRASNAFGPTLGVGFEVPVTQNQALRFSFIHIFQGNTLRFNLPPNLGGAPGDAKLRLNPSVLDVAISFHF